MRIQKPIYFSLVLSFFLMATGCSSSGSSDTTSGGGDATTDDLLSLSNVPAVDMNALDAALQSSSASISAKSLIKKSSAPATQDFSRAGCEVRALFNEAKLQIKQFQAELCFMQAFEEHAGIAVGDGENKYYEVTWDASAFEGEEASGTITDRVKVGVVDDTLTLGLCEQVDEDNSDYSYTLEMILNVSGGNFVGTITDILPSWEDPSVTDAFQVSLDLPTGSPSDWDATDTGSVSFAADGFRGTGSVSLDVTNPDGTIINTVDAAFESGSAESGSAENDFGSWSSSVFGKYDLNEGSANWISHGGFPASTVLETVGSDATLLAELASAGFASTDKVCWKNDVNEETATSVADWLEDADSSGDCIFSDSGTDSFWFDLSADTLSYWIHDNETATYYADVLASTLRDPSAQTIAHQSEWDCEAEGRFEPVTVTMTDAFMTAIEECLAIEEAGESRDDLNSCYDIENEEFAEDDTGEEFGEDDGGEEVE